MVGGRGGTLCCAEGEKWTWIDSYMMDIFSLHTIQDAEKGDGSSKVFNLGADSSFSC